jgi:hypothetical protein
MFSGGLRPKELEKHCETETLCVFCEPNYFTYVPLRGETRGFCSRILLISLQCYWAMQ